MTPETIAAIEGLLESARVQAGEDARAGAKGWAHQYAQDVGDLLTEVARLDESLDWWRNHQRPL